MCPVKTLEVSLPCEVAGFYWNTAIFGKGVGNRCVHILACSAKTIIRLQKKGQEAHSSFFHP